MFGWDFSLQKPYVDIMGASVAVLKRRLVSEVDDSRAILGACTEFGTRREAVTEAGTGQGAGEAAPLGSESVTWQRVSASGAWLESQQAHPEMHAGRARKCPPRRSAQLWKEKPVLPTQKRLSRDLPAERHSRGNSLPPPSLS